MNCCTGGRPGSRLRGSVQRPSSNSAPSPHGGTFAARVHEEELVLELRRLEELPQRAQRDRVVGVDRREVRREQRALVPVRDARRQPVAGEEEVQPLALRRRSAAIRSLIATMMFAFVAVDRAERGVDRRARLRAARAASWTFSAGTSPPAGSSSHSRTASASRTAPAQVRRLRPVPVDPDDDRPVRHYASTTVTRSVTGSTLPPSEVTR